MVKRTPPMYRLWWAGLLFCCSMAMAAEHTGGHAVHGCDAPVSLHCAATVSSAFDRQGRLWSVWTAGGHAYVSHSDDQGRTFSPPFAVNRVPEEIASDGENRPKIALGAKGQVYVSWTLRLEKRFTGHIRFSHSEDGGRSFFDPVTVNDDLAITSHRFDALAATDDGHVYLFWLDKRGREAAERDNTHYLGAAVYYAISTDGGRSFGANRNLADNSCECCRIALTLDGAQRPVVMWRHIFGAHVRDHALVSFAGRDTPDTVRRATEDQWRVEACPHHGPALSVDAAGVYHLVWFTNGPTRQGLFYARSHDGGKTYTPALPFGDNQRGAAHPHVLSFRGAVYIVWQEFDGQQMAVKAMISRDGGTRWSEPMELAATAGKADYPFLLTDGRAVYVSWQTSTGGYRVLKIEGAA